MGIQRCLIKQVVQSSGLNDPPVLDLSGYGGVTIDLKDRQSWVSDKTRSTSVGKE